ncbi:Uncharacterised protein [Yersinia pseudotuberculosis]|nr:Uncharacterised protein [Yersinia pseudotuberculosis]
MLLRTWNTHANQPQQALGGAIFAARLKSGRIGVLTPDAIKLRHKTVVENIEEPFQRLMPFPLLGDIVDIGCRQWRIHTIQPHKGGARRQRGIRLLRISFQRLQFTDREPHARMRTKAHRIINWAIGTPQRQGARLLLQ